MDNYRNSDYLIIAIWQYRSGQIENKDEEHKEIRTPGRTTRKYESDFRAEIRSQNLLHGRRLVLISTKLVQAASCREEVKQPGGAKFHLDHLTRRP